MICDQKSSLDRVDNIDSLIKRPHETALHCLNSAQFQRKLKNVFRREAASKKQIKVKSVKKLGQPYSTALLDSLIRQSY